MICKSLLLSKKHDATAYSGADPEVLEQGGPVTKFLKRGGLNPFFNADFSCYHTNPLSISQIGGAQVPCTLRLNPPLILTTCSYSKQMLYMIGDLTTSETHCHNHFRNEFYGDDLYKCVVYLLKLCAVYESLWIKNSNFGLKNPKNCSIFFTANKANDF